jgi:hypothetical protein
MAVPSAPHQAKVSEQGWRHKESYTLRVICELYSQPIKNDKHASLLFEIET